MSDNHRWNYHAYITGPLDFEYAVTLPGSGEPPVTLRVSKVGGGTVGRAYAGNWYYSASGRRALGVSPVHGDDLRTDSPKTHEEAARALAGHLAGDYPEDSAEYKALTLFAEGELP